MKGQNNGSMLAVNLAGSITRLNARQFYSQPATVEEGGQRCVAAECPRATAGVLTITNDNSQK